MKVVSNIAHSETQEMIIFSKEVIKGKIDVAKLRNKGMVLIYT
jgi:hypothetical protein